MAAGATSASKRTRAGRNGRMRVSGLAGGHSIAGAVQRAERLGLWRMPGTLHHFADFTLDPAQRQLRRGGVRVELNTRYFDALALLVREQGQLVTKDRFLDEVWNGVPVTEEALTQCIRILRRSLGDNASDPAFIETVPKHGYRFIAPVTAADGDDQAAATPASGWNWRSALL